MTLHRDINAQVRRLLVRAWLGVCLGMAGLAWTAWLWIVEGLWCAALVVLAIVWILLRALLPSRSEHEAMALLEVELSDD